METLQRNRTTGTEHANDDGAKKKNPVARKERKGNGKPKAFASFPFHEG
jgi:hypothetical protein